MARIVPQADLDSAFYWDALREHGELRLQRCDGCGHVRFPPLPACLRCGAEAVTIVTAAGTGALYSWIVVHRAFSPEFADDVPYAVATVELDEGARVLARLECGDVEPRIGMRLRLRLARHERWTEPRFVPEEAS